MSYRQLNEASILATLERLRARIAERFPGSGLSRVADELNAVGIEVIETAKYLRSPNYAVRIPVFIVIVLMLGLAVTLLATIQLPTMVGRFGDVIQLLEAGVNDIVFFGIGIYFLIGIEGRLKRQRALRIIHSLRSLAHVVDMHQLTKDPERLTSPMPDTASSPERTMTAIELGRYLDYCSELLSVTSKLAALLAEHFSDEVLLGAVDEIQGLTTGLSGKIWQKITLIEKA